MSPKRDLTPRRDSQIDQQLQRHLNSTLSSALFYPEDGGGTFIRNVGRYLSDYMASHPETVIPKEDEMGAIYGMHT
jgi:hypothetical protein